MGAPAAPSAAAVPSAWLRAGSDKAESVDWAAVALKANYQQKMIPERGPQTGVQF